MSVNSAGDQNFKLSSLAKKEGWEKTGDNEFRGTYKNDRLGEFDGIVEVKYGRLRFYMKDLPKEIQNTAHAGCFQYQGDNLWHVHFIREPKSVLSGIAGVEEVLKEAADSTKG